MNSPNRILTKTAITSILLITGLFGFSCRGLNSDNANSNNSAQTNANSANNPAKDDVAELLTIVRLPEVPEEVVWREETLGKNNDRAPGPNDRKLVAVLKYDAETAALLVTQIEKSKKPEQSEIGAENWFPEELIAQSQISGNEMLKGTTYGANDFFNMPYGNGKITRVENTNYFVLELYTS